MRELMSEVTKQHYQTKAMNFIYPSAGRSIRRGICCARGMPSTSTLLVRVTKSFLVIL